MLDNHKKTQTFGYSGLARLSDLETKEWKELFAILEKDQKAFTEREDQILSPEYKWQRNPLHNWSRIWEYPYVYHQIKTWREKIGAAAPPRVLDVGSGVTFFPFSIAMLGCHVTCTDIDPVCEKDLRRAIRIIPHTPGRLDFKLTDGSSLPFADGEVDAVYCISVLEHIPAFDKMLEEIARVLAPEGLFVLTVDLDMSDDFQLGIKEYKRLTALLQRHFDYLYPQISIHPADILHSASGPYAEKRHNWFDMASIFLKQRIVKPLLGRSPGKVRFHPVAVEGAVMIKKLTDNFCY